MGLGVHISSLQFFPMSRYQVSSFQRSRWRQALRRALRVVLGRDITSQELESRVAGYLAHTDRRSLGFTANPVSSPLLRASDWAPKSSDDPLGGPDGLDIGRSFAASYEDLDILEEALTHAEKRAMSFSTLARDHYLSLSRSYDTLDAQTSALLAQAQAPFFGGPAPGQPSKVWGVVASSKISQLQTTGVLLGGLGVLPTLGASAIAGSDGGQIASATVFACSTPSILNSLETRAWAEDPFSTVAAAWLFTGIGTATINLSLPVTLLELVLSAGTTVVLPIGPQITIGSTTWIAVTPTNSIELKLLGDPNGSISKFRAHTPSFDAQGRFVWGPFILPDSVDQIYTLGLSNIQETIPTSTTVAWDLSAIGPDGPWSVVVPGTPIILRENTQTVVDLSNATADSLSLGYFVYPIAGVSSTQTGSLTAGIGQAKVDAFLYDWAQEKDPLHTPKLSDWVGPNGVTRTVPMSPGVPLTGNNGISQTWTLNDRIKAGSCLAPYNDNQDWTQRSLTSLVITSPDPSNPFVLQPGYNYRFSWAVYTPGGSYLPNVPVGLWNPEGTAGSAACPFSVCVNDSVIYQTSDSFSSYLELSAPPQNYGSLPSQYNPSLGTATISSPAGASWPPYCGRMNITLRPGWNTIVVLLYIPKQTSLGRNAALIFGPDLLSDTTTLQDQTGISIVRGWREDWANLAEFDLRLTSPTAIKEVWSWRVTNGSVDGVLLNHNPAQSETGTLTLDNVLSGSPRNHRLTFTPSASAPSSASPGANPNPRNVWVKAELSSSDPHFSPFISSFNLTAN